MMKIVVLDGQTINPGDLSWNGLKQYGDVTVYPHTDADHAACCMGIASVTSAPYCSDHWQRCGVCFRGTDQRR